MKFVFERKPYSSTDYIECFGRLMSRIDNADEFKFYKLDRPALTWMFALELGSDEKLPNNSIELSPDEVTEHIDRLNRTKAMKAFW